MMRKHVGEKLHTCDVYQFLTMQCLGDVLTKTLSCDVLKCLNIVLTMHISNVFHDDFWEYKWLHDGTKRSKCT